MKKFKVKALASVLIDVGEISAANFGDAEKQAETMVNQRYPRGTIEADCQCGGVHLDEVLKIEASLSVEVPPSKKKAKVIYL